MPLLLWLAALLRGPSGSGGPTSYYVVGEVTAVDRPLAVAVVDRPLTITALT